MRNSTPRNSQTAGSERPPQPAAPLDRKRRRFLLSLGASGAGVAAGAVAGSTVGPVLPPAPTAPRPGSGYHETKHVRDYYRTAKV